MAFFLLFHKLRSNDGSTSSSSVSSASQDMVTGVLRSSTCSAAVRVLISPLPEAPAFDTCLLFAFLAFSRIERTWHCCFDLGGITVGTLEANKQYNYTFSLSRTNFAASTREDV